MGRPTEGVSLAISSLWDGSVLGNGCVGEVLLGGAQLAHGYLADPQLTAAKFVQLLPGSARVYRTGDLGVLWPGGEMQLLGRISAQVKPTPDGRECCVNSVDAEFAE